MLSNNRNRSTLSLRGQRGLPVGYYHHSLKQRRAMARIHIDAQSPRYSVAETGSKVHEWTKLFTLPNSQVAAGYYLSAAQKIES